ncbi:MAG: DUF971 domain-containing protein [Acidobacteriota bacterium]|nr:DUF971 domain-containing protein [Acidobacteriota bacterium]
MKKEERPRPAGVTLFPNGELGIVWSDGEEHYVAGRLLRAHCPCASCVDEMTGERRLDPAALPSDLVLESWTPVGSYAIALRWSDGHDTGIFTFERLRLLAEAAT